MRPILYLVDNSIYVLVELSYLTLTVLVIRSISCNLTARHLHTATALSALLHDVVLLARLLIYLGIHS